jgi:hypothetical protein
MLSTFIVKEKSTETYITNESKANNENYVVQLLTQRKRREVDVKYSTLLKLIPPTSNDCERLFSKCKHVLTPERMRTLPVHFEEIMFLKENRSYWDLHTVSNVDMTKIT